MPGIDRAYPLSAISVCGSKRAINDKIIGRQHIRSLRYHRGKPSDTFNNVGLKRVSQDTATDDDLAGSSRVTTVQTNEQIEL